MPRPTSATWCADAYRILLGADIAFVNGGGVRDNIKVGDITYGDIIKVHPFGATRPASLRSPVSRSRMLWSSAPRPIPARAAASCRFPA